MLKDDYLLPYFGRKCVHRFFNYVYQVPSYNTFVCLK